jgi:hypothetical protein
LSGLKKDFDAKYRDNHPSPDYNTDEFDVLRILGSGAFGIVVG